jgi:glyoxylase-like metal-dependent hydrolase (beta-lactamase superfamily II)
MQIWPDIYLIKGRASNLYLCVDDHGLALIDTGMPGDHSAVLAETKRLGFQPDRLTRILITHSDIDHAGSLAVLQQQTGAAVYAGARTAQFLQKGTSPQHLPRMLQWLNNVFIKYRPVPGSCLHEIADGDTIPVLGGLLALATPGHTRDHFSFYCPGAGILFAGDALRTRSGRLQRSQKRLTADEEAANASAIRLLELAPAVFACGHGRPLTDHSSEESITLFNQLRDSTSWVDKN